MKIPATVNSSIFWFFNNHFNCKLKSFRKDKNRQQIVTELICVDAFMFNSMDFGDRMTYFQAEINTEVNRIYTV